MAFISEIIGRPVTDIDGKQVGVIRDVIARLPETLPHPVIHAIEVDLHGRLRLIPYESLAVLLSKAIPLKGRLDDLQDYSVSESDIFLVRDVLDKQIIDTDGARVVRVNDLELLRVNGSIFVSNVDVGISGILRRLGLGRFAQSLGGRSKKLHNYISWDEMELLQHDQYMRLKVPVKKLSELHPADIAEIISDLNRLQGAQFLDAFDVDLLADALEEVEPEFQASLVENMDDERVADVLEEMDPDDAADLLAELPAERSKELLGLMEDEDAEDVRKLLAYPEDTAGGIMTTEYASIPPGQTAAQAIEWLRENAGEAETINYIYVIDALDHIIGVCSLKALVLAQPDSPISQIMKTNIVSVAPLDDQEEVARIVAKYNLQAVPVVDEHNQLHGIVTADDALDKDSSNSVEEATATFLQLDRWGYRSMKENLDAQTDIDVKPGRSPRSSFSRILRRLAIIFTVFGPATITAIADNDAGGIATYSIAGAVLGYPILFMLIPITVLLAITQEMGMRLTVTTRRGLADLIRERYGVRISVFIFICLIFANMGTLVTELSAVKTTSSMLNIPAIPAVFGMVLVSFWFITRGNYKLTQNIMLVSGLFYIAYIISAIKVQPDWRMAFSNLFYPHGVEFTQEYMVKYLVIGMGVLGTTITPWGQFFVSSFSYDKNIDRSNVFFARLETYWGAFLTDFFSFFMIVATAATLYAYNITLESGEQAAMAIRPFAGELASILFAFGILNAAFMGLVVVSLSGAYAFSEFFGLSGSLDSSFSQSRNFYLLFIVQLGLASLISLIPGLTLFKLAVATQTLNAMMLPFVFFYLIRLTSDRNIMGTLANGPFQKYFAIICTVLIAIASFATLAFALFY